MSQSENKSNSNNLIVPLAIGGGLLLLLLSLKKSSAQNAQELPEANDEAPNKNILPASGQIIPEAAPKYTDLVDNEEENDTSSESTPTSFSPAPSATSSSNYKPLPSNTIDENDDYSSSESGGYQFDNSVPKSNAKPIFNNRNDSRFIGNGKPKMGLKANSDQSKINKLNSMRSFADQAKLAQQKARNISPIKSPFPFIVQAQKAIAQSKTTTKIFPLKQGQTNNYIKEVQRKLAVSPTGFFGTQTRAALLKKYKTVEVSEALYKQMMTGKAPIVKPIIPIKKKVPLIKKPLKIIRKK